MLVRLTFWILILLIIPLSYSQQQITFKGNIKDINGDLIPSVNILIKGTNKSFVSNIKGEFLIELSKKSTVIFNSLGFKSKEIEVNTSKYLKILLERKREALDKIVVIGYGVKREKKSLGTSTFTITNDGLNSSAQSNLANAIKGKVPGANIFSSSSSPGSSSGIILRGINSLNNSNQPLIVVDGVPLNNYSVFSSSLTGSFDFGRGIDGLNVEDIESLTVVKGASETALYGSRAANGLINITTKKGNKNKLSVDIASTVTISNALKVPDYQKEFGQGFFGEEGLRENVSWGPRFSGENLPWGNIVNGKQQSKVFKAQNNQIDEFYKTGIDITSSVSIYGGNKLSYGKLAISSTNSDGINPGSYDTNDRNTLNGAFSTKFGKLNFGGNLNYINIEGKSVTGGEHYSTINSLVQVPIDIDVNSLSDLNNPYNTVSNYFTPYAINPYFALKHRGATLREDRFYGSLFFDYELKKGLTFKYQYGLDYNNQKITNFAAQVKPEENSPNYNRVNDDGFYAEADIMVHQYNHDFTINSEKKHSTNLSSQTIVGLNINALTSNVNSISVNTQDIFGYYSLNNSINSPEIGSNSILGRSFLGNNDLINGEVNRKLYGLFISTTFNYKDMFFVTGNLRNDWNSTLPSKNRSILYGGINTSWIFTEKYPRLKHIINYGKLRLGYGETGLGTTPYSVNSEIVPASVDNQFFRRLNFPLQGVVAYEQGSRAENLDLKAERRQEIELGTELSFFKNRIGFDFTYYYALTKNQILPLQLAPSTGYSYQIANVGTISNEGIEVFFNVNWFKNAKGFAWKSSFNYTVSNSVLENLDNRLDRVTLASVNTTNLVAKEGHKIGLIEGTVPKLSPEGAIVVDGFGIPIADSEKQIYGDTQYDYTLGFTNVLRYKDLSLSFTLDSRQGGLMFSRTANVTQFTGNSEVTVLGNRESFIVPNSVKQVINNEGGISYVKNTTPVSSSDMYWYYTSEFNNRNEVIDKSFVKLREVILNYTFKNILIAKKVKLNKLSLSVIGRNLMIWTPSENKYVDPESSSFGTDLKGQFGEYSLTPNTKSISFSLKANF